MRLAVVLVILASGRLAHADPPDEISPAARLFGEGLALLDAGKPAEACTAFAESYKLEPAAVGTMLNLGICHERTGKLATSLRWYRRAQARSSEMKLSGSEAEAKSKAAAVAARVATLAVKVSNAPAGATVRLDGEKVDDLDLARIEVDAGRHRLELAGATPPIGKDIEVVDGANLDVELAVPLPPRPVRYLVLDPGKAERKTALRIGAVGLGALAVAGVVGLRTKSQHDAVNTYANRTAQLHIARFVVTPIGVAGIAALAYAGVRYFRAPGKQRREVAAVAPLIGEDRAGLVFSSRF